MRIRLLACWLFWCVLLFGNAATGEELSAQAGEVLLKHQLTHRSAYERQHPGPWSGGGTSFELVLWANRPHLKNLPGVHVTVGTWGDFDESIVESEALQAFIERSLRESGIRVITFDEWLDSEDMLSFIAEIGLLPTEAGVIYHATLYLTKRIALPGGPEHGADMMTWYPMTDVIGIAPRRQIQAIVRSHLEEKLQELKQEYRKANGP